jgi:hypothetical protein
MADTTVHDDDAGVLCECDHCTFAVQDADQQAIDWKIGAFYPPRCEDAPCCGCCDGGLL